MFLFSQGMDVWNLVCMGFVSLQILQATLVHFVKERGSADEASEGAGSPGSGSTTDRSAEDRSEATRTRV